jgi:transposase-like protein
MQKWTKNSSWELNLLMDSSSGPTIDFLLSAKRDAAAAERFRAKALGGATIGVQAA